MNNTYYSKKYVARNNINEYNKLLSFIDKNYPLNKNREYQIGFETFGIFLVGLCYWIKDNIEKNNNSELFFLARDGYIIQKSYEILFPNDKTHYMYVSRRSLSLPTINLAKDTQDILNCMVLPPIFNIKVFLNNLGLKVSDYSNILKELDIKEDDLFKRSDYKNNSKLINVIEKIKDDISTSANEQYILFKNYLKQLNFKKNVAIVDIGWHNSIQCNLSVIIDKNTSIDGYYVGVYNDAKKVKKPNSANGYLYSWGDNIKLQYRTFSFVSLFESLFLSHEGSTIGYKTNNSNIVEPIKLKYEYEDNAELKKIINSFQEGALDFVKLYKSSKTDIKLSNDICSSNLICFGCNPTKNDLKIFEKLSFENYEINNIVNFNKNTCYYILHPKKMFKDFYQSGWRIIFLKKLFKVKLPYNSIFDFICKYLKRG